MTEFEKRYPVLERTIWERGIKKSKIAKVIGITPRAFYNKLAGISEWTWPEVCKIQETFFPDMAKDALFKAS